jgi:hypothetical protein
MKRCVLFWGLVLAVSVAAYGDMAQLQMVSGGDRATGWWLLRFFEGTEFEKEIEIRRPFEDWMSDHWNRPSTPMPTAGTRTELTVTPSNPTASDPVSLEVSCWMPASNYMVDQADLKIRGRQITLTLDWVCQGIGFQAFTWRTHTQSLGTFEPGMYMVRVTNEGAASGTTTTSFRVSASSPAP